MLIYPSIPWRVVQTIGMRGVTIHIDRAPSIRYSLIGQFDGQGSCIAIEDPRTGPATSSGLLSGQAAPRGVQRPLKPLA